MMVLRVVQLTGMVPEKDTIETQYGFHSRTKSEPSVVALLYMYTCIACLCQLTSAYFTFVSPEF